MNNRIELLKELLDNITKGMNIYLCDGLCANYKMVGANYDQSVDFTKEFKSIIMEWEHYSGSIGFPIPVTDGGISSPLEQFWFGSLWAGKQKDLRIDLIKYIISVLEKG